MIATIPNDWQIRRSHFNHQWLKNRYISALDSFANLLSGRFRGVGILEDFLSHDLPEWEARVPECGALLLDFEEQMSPRALFKSEPLSNWEPPLREAAGEWVHQLWLSRYPIHALVKNALMQLDAANELYASLTRQIRPGGWVANSEELRTQIDAFRNACGALSRAIEKFPNRILVT